MKFYCNDLADNDGKMHRALYLFLGKEEADRIGPIGTRVSIIPSENDEYEYYLRPNARSRARLHPCKQKGQEDLLEVAFTKGVQNWPITGRTELPYEVRDGDIHLKPHSASTKNIREHKPHKVRNISKKREFTKLPLDLPPLPLQETLRQSGKPSSLGDLEVALKLLNEILENLEDGIQIEIYVDDGKVHARGNVIKQINL